MTSMPILGAARMHFPVAWECPRGWPLAGDSTSQIQPVGRSHLPCPVLLLSYLTWGPQKPPRERQHRWGGEGWRSQAR